MPHALVLLLLLASAWLFWSGPFTLEHTLVAIFGVLSVVGTLLLSLRMERFAGDRSQWPHPVRLLLYLPWFTLEVIKSSLYVTKLVLSPDMPISPRMVRVKATQKTDFGKAVYANSITLTPGTITLDVRGDVMLVHAISEVTAEGLETGEMDVMVTKMEGA